MVTIQASSVVGFTGMMLLGFWMLTLLGVFALWIFRKNGVAITILAQIVFALPIVAFAGYPILFYTLEQPSDRLLSIFAATMGYALLLMQWHRWLSNRVEKWSGLNPFTYAQRSSPDGSSPKNSSL